MTTKQEMTMKDEELKSYYAKFNDEQYIEELNDFLQARQQYLKNNNSSNCITMLLAFDKIYVSTKSLWTNGIISENDFWMLKDELQDVERK